MPGEALLPRSVGPSPLNRKYISGALRRQTGDLVGQLGEVRIDKRLARPHDRELLPQGWDREEGDRMGCPFRRFIEVQHACPGRLVVEVVQYHWAVGCHNYLLTGAGQR